MIRKPTLSDVKLVLWAGGRYSWASLVNQIPGRERKMRQAARQAIGAHAAALEAFEDRATPATWAQLVTASRKVKALHRAYMKVVDARIAAAPQGAA